MLGFCGLLVLTALLAAPGVQSQNPSSPTKYQMRSVDVTAMDQIRQQVPCDVWTVAYQLWLHVFLYQEENAFNVTKVLYVDLETIQSKALKTSNVDGFVVNIFVSPVNNIAISLEYKGLFSQVVLTLTSLVVFFSYTTQDSCTCSTVTYDTINVFAQPSEPDYSYYDYNYDYDNGCASNSTTERACSDCGGVSQGLPCDAATTEAPAGCNSTASESGGGGSNATVYPAQSGGCGCGQS